MDNIKARLRDAMQEGNLTVADLARWFDRPDPTVRGWVNGGSVGGAPLDSAWIEATLKKLEARIRKKQGFPVPRLTPQKRKVYLEKLRAAR